MVLGLISGLLLPLLVMLVILAGPLRGRSWRVPFIFSAHWSTEQGDFPFGHPQSFAFFHLYLDQPDFLRQRRYLCHTGRGPGHAGFKICLRSILLFNDPFSF